MGTLPNRAPANGGAVKLGNLLPDQLSPRKQNGAISWDRTFFVPLFPTGSDKDRDLWGLAAMKDQLDKSNPPTECPEPMGER